MYINKLRQENVGRIYLIRKRIKC